MYFEGLAMLVFLLSLGRFMEQSARRKAGDAAERLVKLVPAFCRKLPNYPDDETAEEAAVVQLQRGDVLLVRAGEVIPADGCILTGEAVFAAEGGEGGDFGIGVQGNGVAGGSVPFG